MKPNQSHHPFQIPEDPHTDCQYQQQVHKNVFSSSHLSSSVLQNLPNHYISQIPANNNLLHPQSAEHLQKVTQVINNLFNKNKINAKNSFDIPFIDLSNMEAKVQNDEETWKKVASTLQNDYKLYGYRVDFISQTLQKMRNTLMRGEEIEKYKQEKRIKGGESLKRYEQQINYNKHIEKKQNISGNQKNEIKRQILQQYHGAKHLLTNNFQINKNLRLAMKQEEDQIGIRKQNYFCASIRKQILSINTQVLVLKSISQIRDRKEEEDEEYGLSFHEQSNSCYGRQQYFSDHQSQTQFPEPFQEVTYNIKKKVKTQNAKKQKNKTIKINIEINFNSEIEEKTFFKNKKKIKFKEERGYIQKNLIGKNYHSNYLALSSHQEFDKQQVLDLLDQNNVNSVLAFSVHKQSLPIKKVKQGLREIIKNYRSLSFHQLCKQYMGVQESETVVNVQLCLVALLHLGNEMNLRITTTPNSLLVEKQCQ